MLPHIIYLDKRKNIPVIRGLAMMRVSTGSDNFAFNFLNNASLTHYPFVTRHILELNDSFLFLNLFSFFYACNFIAFIIIVVWSNQLVVFWIRANHHRINRIIFYDKSWKNKYENICVRFYRLSQSNLFIDKNWIKIPIDMKIEVITQ